MEGLGRETVEGQVAPAGNMAPTRLRPLPLMGADLAPAGWVLSPVIRADRTHLGEPGVAGVTRGMLLSLHALCLLHEQIPL